jgi:arylsulfatase A-like enzyme
MTRKPNVVLIISDQWSTRISDGSGDYETGVQTPAVDRLAAEGVRFTNSYSSYPLCGPARASMFTGLMPHKHGLTHNQESFVYAHGALPTRDDAVTMGQAFKEAGYATAYFGKEHAGEYGWDGMDEFGSYKNTGGGWIGDGACYDPVFTRDAINYLRQDHDQPFYMVLSLINPHDICIGMGGAMNGISIADSLSFCRPESPYNRNPYYLRKQARPGVPANHEAGAIPGMTNPDAHYAEVFKEWTEDDWEHYVATFCLLTENTDALIGQVLDTLRNQELEDDTLVMFTTDHGEMLGSHRLISKDIFYEESARTPMIVRHPGKIAPGTVNTDELVGTIDLMPTLLDTAGLPVPSGLDGKSFKAQCYGEDNEDFKELFAVNMNGRMLRFGPFKYVRSEYDDETYEILFDLEADPDETTNVLDQPGYESVSAQAHQRLDAWLEQEGLGAAFEPIVKR